MGMKKKDRYYLYSFIHILPRKYNIIHNAIFFLSSTSLFIQKGVNSEKNTVQKAGVIKAKNTFI